MPNHTAEPSYAAHRGTIAFIDVPEPTQEALSAALNGGYVYRTFDCEESLLTALGIGNRALDALVIGSDAHNPLDLALAARRQARHLQVILLTESRNVDALKRRADIQADSGDEILIVPALDIGALPDKLRSAIKRAHRRVRADMTNDPDTGRASNASATVTEHLNRILEHAPIGMLVLNEARDVVALNQRARLILGVDYGQIIDKPVFGFFPVFAQKKLRDMFTQEGNGTKQAVPLIVRIGEDPDSSRHVELIVAGPGADGDADDTATMLILHDVSSIVRAQQAQRNAAAALQASEARFHELADVMRMVPWEADPETMQLTYVGDLAAEILDYPKDSWHATDIVCERIHPEDRERVIMIMRKDCGRLQNFDFRFRMLASDGSTRWLRNIVNVVRGDDGTPEKIRGFIVDVSERNRDRENSGGSASL